MQGDSRPHRNSADNDRCEPMRIDEGRNIRGKRANGEQRGVAGFRSTVATCLNGNSTKTWISREGFDGLSRVAAQAVLKYYRQPLSPCIIHVEDRCTRLPELRRNLCHKFGISSAP